MMTYLVIGLIVQIGITISIVSRLGGLKYFSDWDIKTYLTFMGMCIPNILLWPIGLMFEIVNTILVLKDRV